MENDVDFFIIPGFGKNVKNKYDEEEQETLAALQDFILHPIRQMMAKLILHTLFVTFTLLHFALGECVQYAFVGMQRQRCVYFCASVSVLLQQSGDLRAKIGEGVV